MLTVTIPIDKIGTLIGPSGKTIRDLQEEFAVKITVDSDGVVVVAGTGSERLELCIAKIQAITSSGL